MLSVLNKNHRRQDQNAQMMLNVHQEELVLMRNVSIYVLCRKFALTNKHAQS
jgi:hypothetical protein